VSALRTTMGLSEAGAESDFSHALQTLGIKKRLPSPLMAAALFKLTKPAQSFIN
jgi:hypothetical protein